MSYEDYIEKLTESDINLCISGGDAGTIPGKVFEFSYISNTVLYIGVDSVASSILSKYCNIFKSSDDVECISNILLNISTSTFPHSILCSEFDLKYSREHSSKLIGSILNA